MLTYVLAAALLAAVNVVDWNTVIRRAMELAGLSMKEVCADMQIDRAHFERQLNGEGHLSLTRLGRLGPHFLSCLSIVLAHRFGLPEEIKSARRLEEAVAIHSQRRSA